MEFRCSHLIDEELARVAANNLVEAERLLSMQDEQIERIWSRNGLAPAIDYAKGLLGMLKDKHKALRDEERQRRWGGIGPEER